MCESGYVCVLYVWLFANSVNVLVIYVRVFTVFFIVYTVLLYCFIYVYFILIVLSVLV